ncbi:MAG: MBL fold metallo-hydrolase [Lachnospiraceae bacterium]|nr:MBL fold metallo-hydrolase [Lachnospiraceae bacterium]
MKITILGARGSMPTDGKEMLEYGGATSCVLVETKKDAIILDAGSGIQRVPKMPDKSLAILFSHMHVDHLVGLPFLPSLSEKGRRIDFYGESRFGFTLQEQLKKLFSPPFWPLPLEDYPSDAVFHDLEGPFSIGEIDVTFMGSNHPGGGTIFKLEHEGHSLVYATDYEHDSRCDGKLIEFAKDTDLLFYDAQYTEEEFAKRRGFGHSTVAMGLKIMEECGAKNLRFVHHDPRHTDEMLREMEEKVASDNIAFAREGEEILL